MTSAYPVRDFRGARRLPSRTDGISRLAGVIYGLGARLHRASYERGLRARRIAGLPVVSVGALTAGGAGKTPFVRWLAQAYLEAGYRPAILTRGYGRSSSATTVVVSTEAPDPSVFGDEPTLLARSLPEVPVVVGSDRARSVPMARGRGANVLLLDDGFQHHRLERDLDIVLWDGIAARAAGRVLPSGPLREPVSALARADIVVAMDRGEGLPEVPVEASGARHFSARAAVEARQSVPEGTRVHVISGVANPENFERSVEQLGLVVTGATRFPDHHAFSQRDVLRATEAAQCEGADVLAITAKDHVRWPGKGSSRVPTPLVFDVDIEVHEREDLVSVLQAVVEGD